LRDGSILLVAKGSIFLYNHRREQIVKSFSIPRGSRPLFICEHKDGDIFWGEYFGNAERDAVNIYSSTDQGKSWQIAYTFKKNTIRHVHGVFYDPHDDRIWVTTGDENHEAAIWTTHNKFKTLKRVVSGNQQARVLQLLFTPSYVYFGTDTPFERNHIYRFKKSQGNVEKLFPVESSVFWGCKAGDSLFFSTAAEPSQVNSTKTVSIWGSADGSEWKRIASYSKDTWPSKYFQIGQIVFPQGENDTGYLFYTPLATNKDQTIHRIRVSGLFD